MLIPSIDLMDGKAVQLVGGQEKVLEVADVVGLARRFRPYGEIAVIDLDAALGRGDNRALVARLCREASCRVGGGVRNRRRAEELLRAGASRVISPHAIGAGRIVNVLTRPHVVDVLDVATQGVDLEIDEFAISESSPVRGKTLRDAQLRQRANVMVVAIRHADGRTTFNPGPETLLGTNDRIITIGPAGSTSKLRTLQLEG